MDEKKRKMKPGETISGALTVIFLISAEIMLYAGKNMDPKIHATILTVLGIGFLISGFTYILKYARENQEKKAKEAISILEEDSKDGAITLDDKRQ